MYVYAPPLPLQLYRTPSSLTHMNAKNKISRISTHTSPTPPPPPLARVQAVLERQKERGGDGNVPFALAGTLWCCLQWNSAARIGCKETGNKCKRGPCFKREMGMFSVNHMDVVPQEVVLSLLSHFSDAESHWASIFRVGGLPSSHPYPATASTTLLFSSARSRVAAQAKTCCTSFHARFRTWLSNNVA